MLACLLGLKRSLQQPTRPQPICLSGFTAKQVLHQLDSYSAREPNANNLWQHKGATVSHIQFSDLPQLDTNSCSMSLLLGCVRLIFLMMCCNKLLVKQALRLRVARPMCDGRPFASSPLRRLTSRGLFFLCGVHLLWQSLHDHVPRFMEITQTQCSRPYGTTTCYLHTAIWLGKCQCILTQVQRSSEPDMVCHRVSPFSPTNCLPAGPMSLEWPLAQPGGLVQPGHSLS